MPQAEDGAPSCRQGVLNKILVGEVGSCGRFQLRIVALCLLTSLFAGIYTNAYLFTFAKVNTRCYIPECENGSSQANFSPPWIFDAIPAVEDTFDGCHRFISISDTHKSCSAQTFNQNSTTKCQKYVYEHKNSAVFDYNLACDSWRSNLVGSVLYFGNMLALPIGGIVADHWGRRVALAWSGFNVAWIGSMLHFAPNYTSYLLIGFMSELIGGSFYSIVYVLAVEYVRPKYRAVLTATMNSFTAIGAVITGTTASAEPHWRNLVLTIYCPMLIMFLYFWIAPESIRWLISNNRLQEAEVMLKKIVTINKTQLSEENLAYSPDTSRIKNEEKIAKPWLIGLVLKHKPILLRCIVCSISWFSFTFVDTGLTISSTELAGNRYLNYCLVSLAAVPGYWIATMLLTKIGRKPVIIMALCICGTCQLAYIVIPKGNYWLSISVYLMGKVNMAITYTTMLVYNAELYPTQYRARLFGFSITFSSIGGIFAPLIPALAEHTWEHLPFVLFGLLAYLAGCLTIFTPETYGATLPDTMEEAADLGKPQDYSKNTYI